MFLSVSLLQDAFAQPTPQYVPNHLTPIMLLINAIPYPGTRPKPKDQRHNVLHSERIPHQEHEQSTNQKGRKKEKSEKKEDQQPIIYK